jgi:type II secretory pathway component PulC
LLHKGRKIILRLNSTEPVSAVNNNQKTPKSNTAQNNNTLTTPLDKPSIENLPTGIGRVEALLDNAIIEPYSSDGQIQGLRLSGLQNVPFIEDFGLRNGDIIQFVNGQLLTSKQKAYQVFKKARTQPSINIELLRDGEIKELLFDLP